MYVGCYGTKDHYSIATLFPNFELVSKIRETSLQYQCIIIIDKAIEQISSLTSFLRFNKKIKNTTFILLYEDKTLYPYAELFDYAYNIPLAAIDSNTIANIIGNNLTDNLLSMYQNGMKPLDLHTTEDIDIPKTIPDDPHELINTINDMSADIKTLKSHNLYLTKQYLSMTNKVTELYTKLTNNMNQLRNSEKIIEEVSIHNLKLNQYREKITSLLTSNYSEELAVDLSELNKKGMYIIHIKEIDDVLYLSSMLLLLKKKIETLLGLPTKILVLEGTNKRSSQFKDYYNVFNTYDTSKLFSSDFITKLGYSQEFLEDMLNDKSNPRVLVIYNTIQNLALSDKYMINYYAIRGLPSNHGLCCNYPDHTITNVPGYPMSYEHDPNYSYYKSIGLAPYHLSERPIFNNILEDLQDTIKLKEQATLRRYVDEASKIE